MNATGADAPTIAANNATKEATWKEPFPNRIGD